MVNKANLWRQQMSTQTVRIGIPTLHCYDRLTKLIQTLDEDRSRDIQLSFVVIDNGRKLHQSSWIKQIELANSDVTIVVPPRNLGVSASWNLLIRMLGHCIISNDDVIFSRYDIGMLLDCANANPESIFVGEQVGGWSLFWVNQPNKWFEMGAFDENFYPAYYEDNDAIRRIELAGLARPQVCLRDWTHNNSSTLHDGSPEYQSAHWQSFHRNGMYYCQKWGGMPNEEKFTVPFGEGK